MTCETNRRRMLALLGTGVLGAAVSSCGHANVTPPAMGDGATTHLSLHLTDAQGGALSLEALRRIQSNGKGEVGYDDALLDATTLEAIAVGPLYQDEDGDGGEGGQDRVARHRADRTGAHLAQYTECKGAQHAAQCQIAPRRADAAHGDQERQDAGVDDEGDQERRQPRSGPGQ